MTENPASDLLMMTLQVAVPLWIERWRGRSWEDRKKRSTECADIVSEKGDVLQFGGPGCKEAFNAMAEGLAILSFAPGGVKFHGLAWETKENDK